MEKKISLFFIIYFTLGLIFAFLFALYYRWGPLSYFSPGFYTVILTWPFQAPGLIKHLLDYGLVGKPIGL